LLLRLGGREMGFYNLGHDQDDVRGFYSTLPNEVVVGIEGRGYSAWFVELIGVSATGC